MGFWEGWRLGCWGPGDIGVPRLVECWGPGVEVLGYWGTEEWGVYWGMGIGIGVTGGWGIGVPKGMETRGILVCQGLWGYWDAQGTGMLWAGECWGAWGRGVLRACNVGFQGAGDVEVGVLGVEGYWGAWRPEVGSLWCCGPGCGDAAPSVPDLRQPQMQRGCPVRSAPPRGPTAPHARFLPAAAMAEGKIAGLYDLERTLGKGHFAVVKLARHVFTGQRVAVKVIDKSKLAGEAAGQLLQEVRCMKLVQHPNVVRLYEVIDTHSKLYLILELGDGGDMFDHIMRHEGGLAEGRAKHYFAQIVHAISYCHKLHVVHRDLKPENVVFFQEQGVVKLTDFGFSNRFQPGKMLTTSCGSLAYSAPEILLGDEYDAPAVGKGAASG